jgi:tetratricopeptide (TPR) repeat protein
LRCKALRKGNKYEQARDSCDKYLKAAPPLVKPDVLAHVYQGRGLIRAQMKDYPGAIDDYTYSLRLQPDSITRTFRGWAYLAINDLAMALRDFDEAIRLDRKNAHACCGRGLVLARRGRVEEAHADAARVLELEPKSDRSLLNVAHIHAQIIRRIGASTPRNRVATRARLHQEQALGVLGRALDLQATPKERVAFWRKNVRGVDQSLVHTLSDHPEFARLEAELFSPGALKREAAK